MAQYNICFSPTGGTKKVADYLASSLGGEFQLIDLCVPVEARTLTPEDVCLVSIPSYGGRVPGLALERLGMIQGNGAKAIAVCVYGNREWDDTLTELQDSLISLGYTFAGAVAAVAEHSMFRQFAAGRPDEADAAELAVFAGKIRKKLDAGTFGPIELAGSHGPYKPFPGASLKPVVSDACGKCGICAESCPAGAIDPKAPNTTNLAACIGCMRCIALCPEKARGLDPQVVETVGARLAPMLGGHKENYLFL